MSDAFFYTSRLFRASRGSGASALVLAVVLSAVAFAGCSMTPNMAEPEAEADLPDRFTVSADTSSAELLPRAATDTARTSSVGWWTSLNDPALSVLVDSALVGNLDLETARARLDELQARFRIARAPLFPSVNASGNATRQSQPANTGIGAEFGGGGGGDGPEGEPSGPAIDRFSFTTYSASLGLSYEIDFWGRLRSQRKAALSRFFATAADLQNTRIAIISQTISSYTQFRTLSRQAELARTNIDLLQDRFEITQDRYARGIVPSFELYAVRQQLEQARAEEPSLASQAYDARTRLAVLTGRVAGQEQALLRDAAREPLDLEPVPAGLPSDLLLQRPDVMAAAARLEASRQQIGVARAERLPRLSLTAEGGLQSASLDQLLDIDQRFSNFIGNLTAPLFQGGALWAQVEVSKAQYRQQLATYEQTLLTAFQEVKSALVADRQQQEAYDRVQQQLTAAEASAENQRSRYQRGIGDYLALLDAEQNLIAAQQREATVRRQRIDARLALYRALGGPWTEAAPPEDPRLLQ